MRTLIVEDDPMMATVLAMMLEELGIEVCGSEETEDGAVEAEKALAPDLLIVDINLRLGTGIGAVTKILARRVVPHFFVSGDLSQLEETFPRAVKLQKPYVFGQIAQAIELAMAA